MKFKILKDSDVKVYNNLSHFGEITFHLDLAQRSLPVKKLAMCLSSLVHHYVTLKLLIVALNHQFH